jgi:class 3 adenylate cyclase
VAEAVVRLGARAAAARRSVSPVRRLLDFGRLSRTQVATRVLFIAVVTGILLVTPIVLYDALPWVNRPFAGFLLNPRLVVGTAGQYHWTGQASGIRNPDRVVAVAGKEVTSSTDVYAAVRSYPPGTPITYGIARGGRVEHVTVESMRFSWADLAMTFGITFGAGLVYLSIAAIVFLLKPDAEASVAFLVGCAMLSLYTIVSFDVFATHRGFMRFYIVADAVIPAAFLHLAMVFPERRPWLDRASWLRVLPYVVAAVIVIPYQWYYPQPAFVPFAHATRAFAVVAAIAIIVSTLHTCFTGAGLGRQRAKVVLLGAALAFPLPALARASALVGGSFLGVTIQTNFLVVPLVVFPASIAYAIVRHNLFDVDLYIKRAMGYGLMTALVGGMYASLQWSLRPVFRPVFGDSVDGIYPLLFALLVVCLFNPLNRRVQEGVERLFFRARSDYKATVSAVSDALTSMLDREQVVRQVATTVRREMFIDRAGLIVAPARPGPWEVAMTQSSAGDGLSKTAVVPEEPLVIVLRAERALLTRYDIEEDPRYETVRDGCLEGFRMLGATIAIPLVTAGEVTGAIVLGERKSGLFYSREDIDLLTTMANQAAVAIQNANRHEEVVRYAAELAASLRRIEVLESIKSNLAKFVPRTVQALIEESPEAPVFDKREADVSVVFADITGYTRLSSEMELGDVNRLVERYFGAFLDEIFRHGGDVNETAGDGLMVIFQDPDPRRHAQAAVRAAVAIQRRTEEINEELRGVFEPIGMHVGVNSGVASVGATKIEGLAGTRWTYTASGPTTNIAARLAALGQAGSAIVSEETFARLGGGVQAEDLGPQTLKNVPRPVGAFKVVRMPGAPEEPVHVDALGLPA